MRAPPRRNWQALRRRLPVPAHGLRYLILPGHHLLPQCMPQYLTSLFNGKANEEPCTLIRCTFDGDTAANALGSLAANMQTEAGALPNWFGSKKRSKNFVNNFSRYTWAVIPGNHFNRVAV